MLASPTYWLHQEFYLFYFLHNNGSLKAITSLWLFDNLFDTLTWYLQSLSMALTHTLVGATLGLVMKTPFLINLCVFSHIFGSPHLPYWLPGINYYSFFIPQWFVKMEHVKTLIKKSRINLGSWKGRQIIKLYQYCFSWVLYVIRRMGWACWKNEWTWEGAGILDSWVRLLIE